MRARH